MLFFSITAFMRQPLSEEESLKLSQEASLSSMRFYKQTNDSAYMFIESFIDKSLMCVAMISNATLKNQSIENLTKSFLIFFNIQLDTVEVNEITCSTALQKLRSASKGGRVSDYDDVIDELGYQWIRKDSMTEKMIPSKIVEESVMKAASAFFYATGFIEEMKRIYMQSAAAPYCGHPVHYLIEMDKHEAHLKIAELLLIALHANKRIRSKRYVLKKYDTLEFLSASYLKNLLKSCEGGACLIDIASGDKGPGDLGPLDEEALAMLCSVVNEYKHSVLTILCVSPSQKEVSGYVTMHSPFPTWIQINNEGIDSEGAQCYLRDLACSANLLPDESLMKTITSDCEKYSLSQLQEGFDSWQDDYLKRVVYPQYAVFRKEPGLKPVQESTRQSNALAKLQRMIGLHEAKIVIDQLMSYYKARNLYTSIGEATDHMPMHMVFTGNPGTAKTTVARLFAQIMKDWGLLPIGNLIEVGRTDLVGKYVGWTARMVREKFTEAKGSVLFIDEAYSLVDDRQGLYGDEAINTIVQEMENHRDDMAVIFAGYPDRMEGFLSKNPGLRSRVSFHIHFNDYSATELFDILVSLAAGSKMGLSADVEGKLIPLFETARKHENFGNGRFVRSLLEKARLRQAKRLLLLDDGSLSRDDVLTLCADDFELPRIMTDTKQERVIGFGS